MVLSAPQILRSLTLDFQTCKPLTLAKEPVFLLLLWRDTKAEKTINAPKHFGNNHQYMGPIRLTHCQPEWLEPDHFLLQSPYFRFTAPQVDRPTQLFYIWISICVSIQIWETQKVNRLATDCPRPISSWLKKWLLKYFVHSSTLNCDSYSEGE